jgi:hypothetical protein
LVRNASESFIAYRPISSATAPAGDNQADERGLHKECCYYYGDDHALPLGHKGDIVCRCGPAGESDLRSTTSARRNQKLQQSTIMVKVYYVGDWAVQLGPVYAETSFNHAAKGLDLINYGHWLLEAIESSGEFQVKSVPTWDFYNMEPGGYETILAEYDIIIFPDVEAKNFQLNPSALAC